jgi:hypothetical protein
MKQLANRIKALLRSTRTQGDKRLTPDQHQALRRNLAALVRTKEHLTEGLGESRG